MNRLDKLLALRESEPTDPEIHYMIAMERARAGETTQALAGYDECLRLDPDFHYAYYHKAVALDEAGRRDEAKSAAEEGLARAEQSQNAKAASELSSLLGSLG